MADVSAEEYIAQYGANLSEADKRYIRAFGAPQFTPGPSRRPYAGSIGVVDYSAARQDTREADARATSARLDRERDERYG